MPGATLGIVGGGQLGRMLAEVAGRMGYRAHVLAPESAPPAAVFAARHVRAEFADVEAVRSFAAEVDVLTFEFENVSSDALAAAEEVCAVRPGASALHTTQDRAREKAFLARHRLPHVAYRHVAGPEALWSAVAELGAPCVVKTAGFGYDGKGQRLIASQDDLAARVAAERLAAEGPLVVERHVDLRLELSVVGARSARGDVRVYAPIINRHEEHILDLSFTPAVVGSSGPDGQEFSLEQGVVSEAAAITAEVIEQLGLVGLICVEFFLTTDGSLLVNEIAPRPHNSGHLTIEAAVTSQFEQQLRAVCGLPLGDPSLITPAAMINLLGEQWLGREPAFDAALATDGVALHLYGKAEARRGRKMGHLTAVASDPREAVRRVSAARAAL